MRIGDANQRFAKYKYTPHPPYTRNKERCNIEFKIAQKDNPTSMTLSRSFVELEASAEATPRPLRTPLASYMRSFRELERETRTSPGAIRAPRLALETTKGEVSRAHPLAWDVCRNCQLRGAYRDMFHCGGCEEAFHPLCVSALGAEKPRDPRYYDFLCPGCAENNVVLQLLANDE